MRSYSVSHTGPADGPGSPLSSDREGKDDYAAFLRAKIAAAPVLGFEVEPGEVNPQLKDFVREAIVPWAAKGGRRAIFSSFGLHKTSTQIELARLALKRGAVPLIVMPLGVRQEFMDDGERFFAGDHAVSMRFIRRTEEADEGAINLTNFESVREGKIDTSVFGFSSLDEAAILRGFGGTKTFREFMRLFDAVKWRYVATATPDPNEYIELLAYAAYLGVMDVGQAKTRFFKRDSEKADKLTIHPHKEREFWLWVASWALFVRKPSDLGYADDGYQMPELDIRWHEIPSPAGDAGTMRDGQMRLIPNASASVVEASREKRRTIDSRVAALVGIVENERSRGVSKGVPVEEPRAAAGEAAGAEQGALPPEQGGVSRAGEALEGAQSGAVSRTAPSSPELTKGQGLSDRVLPRQQSALQQANPRPEAAWVRPDRGGIRDDAGGAGSAMRDLPPPGSAEAQALRRPLSPDEEGARPALPEVQLGAGDVPGRSGNGHARSGLPDQIVVWCDLNDEQAAIDKALTAAGIPVTSLYGNQSIEQRERGLRQWKTRETTAFVSKPQMYGAGINMQQCHTMIFAGVGFKFHDFIQAVHRCQRYGQRHPVTVHIIHTEAERPIRANLEAKWRRHEAQAETMAAIIAEFGLAGAAIAGQMQRSIGVDRKVVSGDSYTLVNNDCVDEVAGMDAESVDLIVTSIPFSMQYEYTPSYNDFGHTDDDAHFWRQMDFLTPELLRVLRPGRVAAIHVKDRIVPGGMTGLGFQTVSPFSDDCVAHFRKHGFAFLARKTVVTDVVRENNQTYRLGWTEQCKDGSRMGAGLPEYVLLFRKPQTDRSTGYGDVPVVKDKAAYTRGRWQLDAHGFTRSSGNRPVSAGEIANEIVNRLKPDDLIPVAPNVAFKMYRAHSLSTIYDFDHHVSCCEALEARGQLPPTFMLLPPQSWHADVWTDVARMRTLNGAQAAKGREMHLCPLQFDIVDRLIVQFTMEGETVLDPFGGLMTVPYCAVKLKRRGIGIELNAGYFRDGCRHVEAAAAGASTPELFDRFEPAEIDEEAA